MGCVLDVNELKKNFRLKGKVKEVLKGLTFSVAEGEIYGFLGPNGAGKSTTIKIIMGFIKKDTGEIKIKGLAPENVSSKRFIGFMPEHPYYLDTLTGTQYLEFVANIYGSDKSQLSKLLKDFELFDAKDRPIRSYSKGMIQRLGFASAVLHDPDLYILDEPMSGLDPIGRHIFKEKMLELKDKGKSIFFSSHIIPDMEDISDKVGVIKEGMIVKELNRTDFTHFLTEGYTIIAKGDKTKLSDFTNVTLLDETLIGIDIDKSELYQLIESLNTKGFEIINVEPKKKDLEKLFLEMFKNSI